MLMDRIQVYIIGGVGHKCYYNDVWVFDICTCTWTELEIRGQLPQGRFSHTAVVADMDIVIYGGWGHITFYLMFIPMCFLFAYYLCNVTLI